jgi:hypothetical protein
VVAQYPCDRVAIEMILADELPVILYDRNSHVISPSPVVTRIDITDLDVDPAANLLQKLLDQLLTQMTALAAVDDDTGHLISDRQFVQPLFDGRRKTPDAGRLA